MQKRTFLYSEHDEAQDDDRDAFNCDDGRVDGGMFEDDMECSGDDGLVDGPSSGALGRVDKQIKNNQKRAVKRKRKSNKLHDPSRRKPDQDIVHKYARMIHDPVHKNFFKALDSRLKTKVLKFIDDEEKLKNYCRRNNSFYEKPTTESDYTRRQRVKGRIKYHVNKPKRGSSSDL